MNTVAILLATSLLGVDYELVTADSKETVYVITIERELIDQLADGFTINSSLPDNAKNIRQIRIQFATDKAPKKVNQHANEFVPNLTAEKGLSLTRQTPYMIPKQLYFSRRTNP